MAMQRPTTPISQSYHDQIIIVHAVFGAVAVLFTAPAAMLIARYFRRSKWFPWHAWLQLGTLAAIVICFATGVRSIVSDGGDWEMTGRGADLHHQLGLALFILVVVQSLLGAVAHRLAPGNFTRHARTIAGVIILALLYYQFESGFGEWNRHSDSGTTVPRSVVVIFWILLALEVAAYLLGWVVAPKPALKRVPSDASDTPMRQTA